ncbi:MAG TPA: helix-turn-helix transcriptional regulator [Anaerolineales bacterium]|nr:helix-turn-helix transcriptional regulator [Anaerolineales bacterium]
MATSPLAITIRKKKLGVLIRNARRESGRSPEECARAIKASPDDFEAYEMGEKAPSLPDIEALAFYLKLPLEYFLGQENQVMAKPGGVIQDLERLMALRNRMIGARLRQARNQAALSLEELAEHAGIPDGKLGTYEFGEQAIPLPELEALARTLDRPIADFLDNRGPIGEWRRQQRLLQEITNLPRELQDFVTKPINRPYLEIAQRLSQMSVEKLRAVAEGLLEITL